MAPYDKIEVVHFWPEHTMMHAQSILSGQIVFLSLEEGGHLETPRGLGNDQRAFYDLFIFYRKHCHSHTGTQLY